MQVTVSEAIFVDGKPNIPVTDETPPWLTDGFKYGTVGVVRMDDNRVTLAVKTAKGIIIAEAGDKISNDLMFGLVVEKKNTNTLTWDVVEKMLQERVK